MARRLLGQRIILLDFALRHGKVSIDTEDCEDRTELVGAAAEGHASLVRILLDHGASVSALDVRARTALCYAAVDGHTDIVGMLRNAGADVDHRDDGGHSPPALTVVKLCLGLEERDLEDGYLGFKKGGPSTPRPWCRSERRYDYPASTDFRGFVG